MDCTFHDTMTPVPEYDFMTLGTKVPIGELIQQQNSFKWDHFIDQSSKQLSSNVLTTLL